MKTMQNLLKKPACFIIAMLFGLAASFAQGEAIATKNLIESQRYIFKAQTANPASGRTRQLTTEYDLKVSKDTIISYLPYFGRAYSAPADLTGGGINFTSMQFEYSVSRGKKNRWEIIIKPKDANDVQELSLTVFENGKADLQVRSNNRQPISFNGYITGK
jgi:hypothetical protein